MKRWFRRLSLKLKLFSPVYLGIILSISIITAFSISKSSRNIHESVERNLTMEVHTLMKMMEREHALKQETVEKNLRVAHSLFYNRDLKISDEKINMIATNQITRRSHLVEVNEWYLGDEKLHSNSGFVNDVVSLVGGTVTVFQKIDNGFLRISTNVLKTTITSAEGTFIPNNSPVAKADRQEKPFTAGLTW